LNYLQNGEPVWKRIIIIMVIRMLVVQSSVSAFHSFIQKVFTNFESVITVVQDAEREREREYVCVCVCKREREIVTGDLVHLKHSERVEK